MPDDLRIRPTDQLRRDPSSAQGLAIFDLDRTLVPGSSLVPFGYELVRRRLLSPTVVVRHALSARRFSSRGERDDEVSGLQADLLALAAGREHGPLAGIARQVGSELANKIHPTARWLLDRHLAGGDFVVVVSGSVHELVEAFAQAAGAHRGVGTRVAVANGRLTGGLDGPLCHGAGKLVRLRQELGELDLDCATAYADSASDQPLLDRAGVAVAVNPDRRLAATASQLCWPRVTYR